MLFGLEAFISRVSAASRHITCGEQPPSNSQRLLALSRGSQAGQGGEEEFVLVDQREKQRPRAMLAAPLQPQPEPAQAANPLARLDFDAAEAQSPTRGSGKKDPLRPSIGGACASLCPSLPATFA